MNLYTLGDQGLSKKVLEQGNLTELSDRLSGNIENSHVGRVSNIDRFRIIPKNNGFFSVYGVGFGLVC